MHRIRLKQFGYRAAAVGRVNPRLELVAKFFVRCEELLVCTVVCVVAFEVNLFSIEADVSQIASFLSPDLRRLFCCYFHCLPVLIEIVIS